MFHIHNESVNIWSAFIAMVFPFIASIYYIQYENQLIGD